MDLLVFSSPGLLWRARPGEFSTCDSEGPRAWLESASAWRPDAGQIDFSLVISAGEGQPGLQCAQSSGVRIKSTPLAVTLTIGQG